MRNSEIEAILITVVQRVRREYPDVEWEDLVAQGWLIVTERIGEYDKGRGASLSTYLYNTLYGWLRTYVQRDVLRHQNMRGLRVHVDYEEQSVGTKEAQVDARMTMERMLTVESGVARDILQLMMKGNTQSEVAALLGISRQRVHEVLKEIREKWESKLC